MEVKYGTLGGGMSSYALQDALLETQQRAPAHNLLFK